MQDASRARVPSTMADVGSMSVKELKGFISARGMEYSDCVEKADLMARAREAESKAPKSPQSPVLRQGPVSSQDSLKQNQGTQSGSRTKSQQWSQQLSQQSNNDSSSIEELERQNAIAWQKVEELQCEVKMLRRRCNELNTEANVS